MIRYSIFFTALISFFIQTVRAQEISSKYNLNWPQWRGPESTGVALAGNPPIEWSVIAKELKGGTSTTRGHAHGVHIFHIPVRTHAGFVEAHFDHLLPPD